MTPTWLRKTPIAHRGLHGTFPENSVEAFLKAAEAGFAIELDVHLSKDKQLVVFHDNLLKRMTGRDGKPEDYTLAELEQMPLGGTFCTLPSFEKVLCAIGGKVPILIEIKNQDLVGELENILWQRLKSYPGEYAIQAFNPFVLAWFAKNAPLVVRGQLASFFKGETLAYYKKFLLRHLMLNGLSKPHFISYSIEDYPKLLLWLQKKRGRLLLAWTVRSQEEFLKKPLFDNMIFENFIPK